MAYSSMSIKELIAGITANKYYLPAIQRKFVWGEGKICRLFNSIMRDYPIGTFLFWDLSAEKANQYTFYEFLKTYHERDSKNSLVRYDFEKEVRGVLDGQQRISSMYIALQGVFCTKRKYAKSSNDDAYPQRQFYLNLLGDDYDFKFLSNEDSSGSESTLYYLVRDILTKSEDEDPDSIINDLIKVNPERKELIDANRHIVRTKINRLLKKFNDPQLVSFFRIIDKDLDDILDIFVRVNSGGTILSKSDLLFSTLVAHWEDGRNHIEKLIDDMNGEDGLFGFNTDFLMRTCLFLIDAPMSFKVTTFDKNNISKIRDNWNDISTALISTASILREFGFNKTRLSSNYAATPIAYYLFNKGVVDNATKVELRQLVINSLLKQVFSGQADTALSGLREGLRMKVEGTNSYKLKNTRFSFVDYQHTKLSGGKRLTIDAEDIQNFLDYKKGAFSFLLLSMLYPDLKLDQISFHQDHMHPYSKFAPSKLSEAGLDSVDTSQWLEMRDKLPNLQLLEGLENVQKQATHLAEWVESNEGDEAYYRDRNYIPADQSLAISEFESFYTNRQQRLKVALENLLLVQPSPAVAKTIP